MDDSDGYDAREIHRLEEKVDNLEVLLAALLVGRHVSAADSGPYDTPRDYGGRGVVIDNDGSRLQIQLDRHPTGTTIVRNLNQITIEKQ